MKDKFRTAGRALLMLFGVVGLLCTFMILLNLYDPHLKPEVQKVLESRSAAKDAQMKAFYYLVGLSAGQNQDTENAGKKLWDELQTLPLEKQSELFYQKIQIDKNLWKAKLVPCKSYSQSCGTAELEKKPELAAILDQNRIQLDQYMTLNNYGAAATHFQGSEQIPFGGFTSLNLTMHRLMTLQWSVWLKKGGAARVLDSIETSNNYLQSAIETGTLLDRLIGLTLMRTNVEYLLEESAKNPKLKSQITPDLIASFRTPNADDILAGAMDNELRHFVFAMRSVRSLNGDIFSTEGAMAGPKAGFFLSILKPRFFFRPNETINRYYDILAQSLATDCPEISDDNEVQCIPAMGWVLERTPMSYLANPLGRSLIKVFASNITRRRSRIKEKVESIYSLREQLNS